MPDGWASICGSTAAIPTGARGRCGDLVVEIAHDLKKGVSDRPDHLWGLSWRTSDIAKANARLKAAGLAVSEPRDGRRPGSQVFSVTSATEGVPTLIIGGIGRW